MTPTKQLSKAGYKNREKPTEMTPSWMEEIDKSCATYPLLDLDGIKADFEQAVDFTARHRRYILAP